MIFKRSFCILTQHIICVTIDASLSIQVHAWCRQAVRYSWSMDGMGSEEWVIEDEGMHRDEEKVHAW